MEKKAINGKTWMIIGVVVVLLAVFVVVGYTISRGGAGREENLLELGQRYLDELYYEQAIVCFEEYLEIDPQCVEAYLGLAEAYEELQNYEKALEVLEEGYAVTGDARLQKLSSRLQEQYGQILTGEQNPTDDRQEASELQPENHTQPEGFLKEILVFDGTYEEYGNAYGGSIPVKKDGMWGAINYDNEVIVPFEYTEFYSAPDNLGNFVLYHSVFAEETYGDETYNVVQSREFFLFDNQGNVLYQGEDEVKASGGLYITRHDEEQDTSLITYHRLDGSELVSWGCSYWKDNWLKGFYDGISNLYDDRHDGPRIGTVDQQGNLSWTEEPFDKIEESASPGGSVSASTDYLVLSTMNHGYYVKGYMYIDPGDFIMHDANGNKIATVDYGHMTIDENGMVSIDENALNFSNSCRGYWVDGFYFYNYGSQMVLTVDDKNVLVDLTRNTVGGDSVSMDVVMAVYDSIVMADENYWLVQSGEQWGYIDHDGNEMAMFDDAGEFRNGYALVVEDGEAWLIDEEFQLLENLGQADSVRAVGELYCVRIGDDMHLYQLQ